MGLRARRRNVVLWRSTHGPRGRHGFTAFPRRASTRPLRRFLRVSAVLTAIGLRRWWAALPGLALIVTGVVLRGIPGALAFLSGFLFLYGGLRLRGGPAADRARLGALERELADYSTPAQRADLEAILDRYAQDDTNDLRDILARQAAATQDSGVPGLGRPPAARR